MPVTTSLSPRLTQPEPGDDSWRRTILPAPGEVYLIVCSEIDNRENNIALQAACLQHMTQLLNV